MLPYTGAGRHLFSACTLNRCLKIAKYHNTVVDSVHARVKERSSGQVYHTVLPREACYSSKVSEVCITSVKVEI